MPTSAIDVSELNTLVKDLRKLDKTAGRRIAREMKKAAQFVAADAQQRAAFSSRIPRSIKVSATQKALTIKSGGSAAPHAAVYEFGGRHPLWGNKNHWYPVRARHYLTGARDANMDKLAEGLMDAVVAAISTKGS